MRVLTPKERAKIEWSSCAVDTRARAERYKDLVREFAPKVLVNRAAKELEIELRWAPHDPKATELFVELKG
jgi:hypothetical protein